MGPKSVAVLLLLLLFVSALAAADESSAVLEKLKSLEKKMETSATVLGQLLAAGTLHQLTEVNATLDEDARALLNQTFGDTLLLRLAVLSNTLRAQEISLKATAEKLLEIPPIERKIEQGIGIRDSVSK
jgi:hypothetical protein